MTGLHKLQSVQVINIIEMIKKLKHSDIFFDTFFSASEYIYFQLFTAQFGAEYTVQYTYWHIPTLWHKHADNPSYNGTVTAPHSTQWGPKDT